MDPKRLLILSMYSKCSSEKLLERAICSVARMKSSSFIVEADMSKDVISQVPCDRCHIVFGDAQTLLK
jgi:hypothetical protein